MVDRPGYKGISKYVGRDQIPSSQGLKAKPSLPFNMSAIYWNARGIARTSFKPNFRLIMQDHDPSIVILAETHASRQTTEKIIQKLPFESWFLVDPIGFAGGFFCFPPALQSPFIVATFKASSR